MSPQNPNIAREQKTQDEKKEIFMMALSTKHFVDIHKKLQTLDFNVNTECDKNGDFLVHLAARRGLSYLPLLMTLVKSLGADIELPNAQGMTPLMLAAAEGDSALCDVMICLLRANTNTTNARTGRSALYYAAEARHRNTVECLIHRGADINMEDHDGLRADDILTSTADNCREIIAFIRAKRIDTLAELVFKEEILASQIFPSDLSVVDVNGNTLIMTAAVYNKFKALQCLLDVSKLTINAQHGLTGMTAVAMAAKLGNLEVVDILFRNKACPTITDMKGYLALHHAVLNNHAGVVDAFLGHFPITYTGLYKAIQLSTTASMRDKLKAAWKKRQEKIVMPKLLECAVNGQAEELYRLLEDGDSITQENGTSWPLCLAVENGYLDVLQLLHQHGDVVSSRHPITGDTLLHVASRMGHLSIVSYLLRSCQESHENLSAIDNTVQRPGYTSKPHQCRRKSRGFLDINIVDRNDQTALHIAVDRGFSHIVKLLLSHGASTSIVDKEGRLLTCAQYEGIQVALETHRRQHTDQVMACIEEGSQKALRVLNNIWLPRLDHHLRDSTGSTPLMIASRTGKIPVIKFLLDSAVYPEIIQCHHERDNNTDSESDTDSGVLDLTSGSPPQDYGNILYDIEASLDSVATSTDLHESKSEYFSLNPQRHGSYLPEILEFQQRKLASLDNSVRRHKGQPIYHDGLVSHVCALNLKDGRNALHYALYNSDAPQVLALLLQSDPTPLIMQDDRGETALHMACRLGRRKSVELILTRPDVDLNICTFDGATPEDLAESKVIRKMLEKAKVVSRRQSQASQRRTYRW
ncbi:hypothetical protein BsWGS_18544 [Bradybaena similaris]